MAVKCLCTHKLAPEVDMGAGQTPPVTFCPDGQKKPSSTELGIKGWPTSVICDVVDIENVPNALRNGPYGKCVYDTDNDVVSHQCEITVEDGKYPPIKVFDFLSQRSESYTVEDCMVPGLAGHGGADYHTVKAFVDALHNPDIDAIATGPDDTLASHLLCFAAERARKENRVLNINSRGEFE